jgi:hypothetical protein
MATITAILFNISYLLLGITLIGFFKPWWVLWWSDFINREKILKIYFFPALLMMLLANLCKAFV